MVTDKSNIICILKILEEYSDEDHILAVKDIQDKLHTLFGVRPDRRTIYGAINALEGLGYDISDYEDNGKGYFLRVRDFDSADIRLLMDAVRSFEYISQKQTDELVEKLQSKMSVYDRKRYGSSNIMRNDKKSLNSQVFLNIDLIDQAINEKKMISFTYMDYDLDKKLKPRRCESYIASPYVMMVESEHYYLVLIKKGHTEPGFYRIDMMKDIEILDDDIEFTKQEAKLDSIRKVVYAHAGTPEHIRLKCDKSALRYCLERFGLDIIIIPSKDGQTFEAVFDAPPAGIVYWALQQVQSVEVLAPEHLRQEVIGAIKNNKYGV